MVKNLPKIELHCHLDGSVRPETILDIAKKENIELFSYDINEIRKSVIAPEECTSLNDYLKSFKLPNLVMQTRESLERITFELFEDASKENVKYMEVRFAPILHTEKGLTMEEVIDSVLNGIRKAEATYNIKGNLILGCLRFMSEEVAIKTVEAGKGFLKDGVVAIDLCANEDRGFAKEFKRAIDLARNYGYRVTIHAGETGIGENVLESIELLGAERIGHGVFIRDCKEAYDAVKAKGVFLEMCPTSNVQTKAVNGIKDHPLYDYHKGGIKVTINTDNRTVSNVDMTNEINLAINDLGLTYEEYKKIYLNSIDATFADDETKEWLKSFV